MKVYLQEAESPWAADHRGTATGGWRGTICSRAKPPRAPVHAKPEPPLFVKLLFKQGLLAAVFFWSGAAHAASFYPVRPDDPRAVVFDSAFSAHADGIGDDSDALQRAIDRVQETTGAGVLLIPEGRYRLGKTVHVWQGIRLLGYGATRPVFVLARDTPKLGMRRSPKSLVVASA